MDRLLYPLIVSCAALPALALTVGLASLLLRPAALEVPDPALERALQQRVGHRQPLIAPAESFAETTLMAIDRDLARQVAGPRLDPVGLATVTGLTATHNGLSRLDGLQWCPELTQLNLAHNDLVSLRPVAHLTRLERVNLSSNRLRDLRGLLGHRDLRQLAIADNELTTLLPLSYAPHLQSLDVSGNAIASLAPLSDARELAHLNVSRNRLTSLAGVGSAPALRSLDARHNEIVNLAALTSLPLLETLHLDHNALVALDHLPPMPRLREASFGGSFGTIDGVAQAPGLRILTLQTATLPDLTPLLDLPELESLTLRVSGPVNLAPLAGHSTLRRLRVETPEVGSIHGLDQCTSLEIVNLVGHGTVSLAQLRPMTRLQVLLLEAVRVADWSPLQGHPSLATLGLRHVDQPAAGGAQALTGESGGSMQLMIRDEIALPGIGDFYREEPPTFEARDPEPLTVPGP